VPSVPIPAAAADAPRAIVRDVTDTARNRARVS